MDPSRASSDAPVFLLGFQRSGTTLLQLYLDAHSQLAVPFESFVLIDVWHRLSDYGDLERLTNRTRLVDDLLAAKGIRAWNPRVTRDDIDVTRCSTYAGAIEQIFGAYARLCGKRLWGDKTPSYTSDFHVLNELFPHARFVHLIRDGRDVALSIVRQPWGPSDFIQALSQWNEVVTWTRKMGRLLPSTRYMEIRYEDLVHQPEATLRRLTTFLGLAFEPAMLEAHSTATDRLPARALRFHPNVSRPPDAGLVFQWQKQLTSTDQAIAQRIAGPLLAELGYPASQADVGALRLHARRLWLWMRGGVKWRVRRIWKRAAARTGTSTGPIAARDKSP